MIITRTPFRVSFFGGGTDIREWFRENTGQVLSTAINKYCYVTARNLPPFFNHSIRLAYSKVETVSRPEEVEHPLVRAILSDLNRNNVEIHYDSDLPGSAGLGSSSSFGVGLVSALTSLDGRILPKQDLAHKVIYYERDVLKEAGGLQDQVAAAYGGFNHITFSRGDEFSVNPVVVKLDILKELKESLMLFFIPIHRRSADVSLAKNFDKKENGDRLTFIDESVNTALRLLQAGSVSHIGELLHETWLRKREFARVTNKDIDDIYMAARAAGASGGKILGAGGGGFFLIFCHPAKQEAVRCALDKLLYVPFDFEHEGTKIIYYHSQ